MQAEEVDSKIENAVQSLAMEGIIMSESEKEAVRKCLLQDTFCDDFVASIVKQYSKVTDE